jgi:hypothetical protein
MVLGDGVDLKLMELVAVGAMQAADGWGEGERRASRQDTKQYKSRHIKQRSIVEICTVYLPPDSTFVFVYNIARSLVSTQTLTMTSDNSVKTHI